MRLVWCRVKSRIDPIGYAMIHSFGRGGFLCTQGRQGSDYRRMFQAPFVSLTGSTRRALCRCMLSPLQLRVRELESEKRKVDRALEEVRAVARKREAKAKQSLAALRLALKGVEDREEERYSRWRSTTRVSE